MSNPNITMKSYDHIVFEFLIAGTRQAVLVGTDQDSGSAWYTISFSRRPRGKTRHTAQNSLRSVKNVCSQVDTWVLTVSIYRSVCLVS